MENKDLSLLLFSLTNMGYSDPEFFVPIFNNIVQYDKISFLQENKFIGNKNKVAEFSFTVKDISYYLNSLAFLNYNDEKLIKFFLNKLENIFNKNDNNSFNENESTILLSNKNNDLAISMILISLTHLNSKLNF